jgi:hypothetical protein
MDVFMVVAVCVVVVMVVVVVTVDVVGRAKAKRLAGEAAGVEARQRREHEATVAAVVAAVKTVTDTPVLFKQMFMAGGTAERQPLLVLAAQPFWAGRTTAERFEFVKLFERMFLLSLMQSVFGVEKFPEDRLGSDSVKRDESFKQMVKAEKDRFEGRGVKAAALAGRVRDRSADVRATVKGLSGGRKAVNPAGSSDRSSSDAGGVFGGSLFVADQHSGSDDSGSRSSDSPSFSSGDSGGSSDGGGGDGGGGGGGD